MTADLQKDGDDMTPGARKTRPVPEAEAGAGWMLGRGSGSGRALALGCLRCGFLVFPVCSLGL